MSEISLDISFQTKSRSNFAEISRYSLNFVCITFAQYCIQPQDNMSITGKESKKQMEVIKVLKGSLIKQSIVCFK